MAWALVTGGAKRLGAALCLSLAAQGHSVAIHYRQSKEQAEKVAKACRAQGVEAETIGGDFSTADQLASFSKRYLSLFPETAVMIHNVGNYLVRPLENTSPEEWVELFQVNLHAPFILTQHLIPALIRHQGRVIHLGVCGLMGHRASLSASAYMLTKEALWGLTRIQARAYAPYGVTVNMVSPGQLDISVDRREVPMGREGTCHEVCQVVNFLLSQDNRYITGQNIEVAGGLGL